MLVEILSTRLFVLCTSNIGDTMRKTCVINELAAFCHCKPDVSDNDRHFWFVL